MLLAPIIWSAPVEIAAPPLPANFSVQAEVGDQAEAIAALWRYDVLQLWSFYRDTCARPDQANYCRLYFRAWLIAIKYRSTRP